MPGLVQKPLVCPLPVDLPSGIKYTFLNSKSDSIATMSHTCQGLPIWQCERANQNVLDVHSIYLRSFCRLWKPRFTSWKVGNLPRTAQQVDGTAEDKDPIM